MLRDKQMVEKLSQFRDYGDAILKIVELVEQNLPSQGSWVPSSLNEVLQNLKKSAQRTKQLGSSPFKIGLMGEFNAGKTLLLGSLIGYADALPVNEVPTTGNVTAIHLIQQSEFQTTKIGKFTVHYLNHSGIKDCLAFMLEEAERRVRSLNLPTEPVVSLQNSLKSTSQVEHHRFLAWCEQVWSQAKSLELRSLLRELVTLIRTHHVYGSNICGKSYQVDQATAKEGLKLSNPPSGILELDFRQLPLAPKPWKTFTQPCAEDLQSSFSLIQSIDVDIEISKEVWDLSSFKGTNEFVLLDFPGLGADDSGVRDAFLSLRELKEVQTILLLLDGRRPGAATAAKIRSMLEQDKGQDLRDRIIVGVGRFNQLPLDHNDELAIEILLGEANTESDLFESQSSFEQTESVAKAIFEAPMLSEEEVLERVSIFKRTIVSANNLTTEKENVVLLSQIHGLARLAESSRLIKVCSPEFLPQLSKVDSLDDAQMQIRWRRLSQALPAKSTLKRQLNDFVEDGGVGRLRTLMREHIALHGLKQIFEDTQTAAKELNQRQRELKKILDDIPSFIPVVESAGFLSLRETIARIARTYSGFQTKLEEQPTLTDRRGVALNDVIKDELLNEVYYNWNEWLMLFDRSQTGIFAIKEPKGFSKTSSIVDSFIGLDEDDESIPTKSDDFYAPFKRTLEEAQESIYEHVIESVKILFRELASDLEPERRELSAMLRNQDEQYINETYGKRSMRLLKALSLAIEPIEKLQQPIIEKIGVENNVPPINKVLFPLASADEIHKQGQLFDWHPCKRYPESPPRPFNHLIFALRLRQAIISSAEIYLNQYLSQLIRNIRTSLSPEVTKILSPINELLKPSHEGLLKYLISAEGENRTSNPAWLEQLAQIVEISYPS